MSLFCLRFEAYKTPIFVENKKFLEFIQGLKFQTNSIWLHKTNLFKTNCVLQTTFFMFTLLTLLLLWVRRNETRTLTVKLLSHVTLVLQLKFLSNSA